MPRKKLESEFRSEILEPELKRRFPGCEIIVQDPGANFQGIPDRMVLCDDKWAMLETKRAPNSAKQENQDHYVKKFNRLGYAAFVHPENMLEVLSELEEHFSS